MHRARGFSNTGNKPPQRPQRGALDLLKESAHLLARVPWMRVSATFFSHSVRIGFGPARLSKLRPFTALSAHTSLRLHLPLCRACRFGAE